MKNLNLLNFLSHDWNSSFWFFCFIFWKICDHFLNEKWKLSAKKWSCLLVLRIVMLEIQKIKKIFKHHPLVHSPSSRFYNFSGITSSSYYTLNGEVLYDFLYKILWVIFLWINFWLYTFQGNFVLLINKIRILKKSCFFSSFLTSNWVIRNKPDHISFHYKKRIYHPIL